MFEDLVPQNNRKATTTPTKTGGMFADLIPDKTGSAVPAYVKATNPQAENDAWFKYDKNDSLLETGAKTIGNAPKSLWNIGKGIYNVVRHPVDTVQNIGNLIGGTVATGAEKLIENTDIGQEFLNYANESRKARGLPELVRKEDGSFDAPDTDQMTMAKNTGKYFKDRYGGWENIKRSTVEDPAGIALDVSALFTGGSTLAPKVAKVAEVADMARTANTINKVGSVMGKIGEVTDPIRQTAKIATPVVTRKLNDVNDVLKMSGNELKSKALKEGLYGMNETIGSLKKRFEDTSYTYVKPDGTKVDINPIDTMVEYNLIPQPAKGGSLNVTPIKEKLPSLKKDLDTKIDTVLKTDNKTISISDYGIELEKAIEKLDKSKLEKTRLAQKLDGELEALQKAYPDGQIPLDEINKIRKEANAEFREDKVDFARVTGNATREVVYNATDDMVVKDLLNEQRKLINMEDYVNKLSIHKVKGGRLGNYVYSTMGAIVGGATKLPFGVGETIGAVGGRGLSELLQRRQLKSLPADVKSGLEKMVGRPLTVDVKGGLEKVFGQKSPKSQPDMSTPKTTAKTDSINKSISQELDPLEKYAIKNGNKVYYHATPSKNADSIMNNGFKGSTFVWDSKEKALEYIKSLDDGDEWTIISGATKETPDFGKTDPFNGDGWKVNQITPLKKYKINN